MSTYRPMQPTAQARRRLPEAGRIRLGHQVRAQSGKMRPDKLSTLRFTSETRTLIEAIADLHGGAVKPWLNGKRQEFEVITESSEIPVILPPDPLGDGATYEMWAGGSLQRRCDGEVAVCPTRVSNDEVAMVEKPCICNERQLAECKVTLRLNVIIPDIPFGGTWRLDTHSWNAEAELPGMVEAIQAFQSAGFSRAVLGVRQEEKMVAGRKQNYIVPYLRSDVSVQQALEGKANLLAIPGQPVAVREIGPGPGTPEAEAGVERPVEGPAAPPVYTRMDAKHRLKAVVNGDNAKAKEIWDQAGWGDAPTVPVAEYEVAVEVYLKAKYPGAFKAEETEADEHAHEAYLPDPDDEIVDAEVVEDEGRPFE